jgi:hypothetical protein
MVREQYGSERATVYPEGGIGFEYRLAGGRLIGWLTTSRGSRSSGWPGPSGPKRFPASHRCLAGPPS